MPLYLATHDGLTDLFNRHRFEEELLAAAQRATRFDTSGAVLMLDIDNFKYVNDSARAFGRRRPAVRDRRRAKRTPKKQARATRLVRGPR